LRAVDQTSLNEVCKLISKGSKVLIGRDASGRHKLKIKTGPFGLWTKRYSVDAETMDMLRARFGLNRT
jgi:hypothetical protein